MSKQVIGDKIVQPDPTGSFEKDILSRTSEEGEFEYLTPKNGVVKLNDPVTNTLITDGTKFKIVNQLGSVFTDASRFPKNISNLYPGQNPVANYSTFIDHFYNSSLDRWLENPQESQDHFWRLNIKYTRGATTTNREIVFNVENPLTGFVESDSFPMPNGAAFQTFEKTFLVSTQADSGSIGNGYDFFITPNGDDITINNSSLKRTSLEFL